VSHLITFELICIKLFYHINYGYHAIEDDLVAYLLATTIKTAEFQTSEVDEKFAPVNVGP
jgi:hypothetical protein